MSEKALLCPSAKCQEGASLLGVVQADGRTAYLSRPLAIDRDFVAMAAAGRKPETRFRFTDTCAECQCRQWRDGRCGVVDAVERLLPQGAASMPRCGIRPRCRWFAQSGPAACSRCPDVTTEVHASPHDAVSP